MLKEFKDYNIFIRLIVAILSIPLCLLLWGLISLLLILLIPLFLLTLPLILIYFVLKGEYLFESDEETSTVTIKT